METPGEKKICALLAGWEINATDNTKEGKNGEPNGYLLKGLIIIGVWFGTTNEKWEVTSKIQKFTAATKTRTLTKDK